MSNEKEDLSFLNALSWGENSRWDAPPEGSGFEFEDVDSFNSEFDQAEELTGTLWVVWRKDGRFYGVCIEDLKWTQGFEVSSEWQRVYKTPRLVWSFESSKPDSEKAAAQISARIQRVLKGQIL